MVQSVSERGARTLRDLFLPAALCSRRRPDASAWKAACVTTTTRSGSCCISSTPWYSSSRRRCRSRRRRKMWRITAAEPSPRQLSPPGLQPQGFWAPPAASPPSPRCTSPSPPPPFLFFYIHIFFFVFHHIFFFVRLPPHLRGARCSLQVPTGEQTAITQKILLSVEHRSSALVGRNGAILPVCH